MSIASLLCTTVCPCLGNGATAQAARHSAASLALRALREVPESDAKSKLDPTSVPFVPGETRLNMLVTTLLRVYFNTLVVQKLSTYNSDNVFHAVGSNLQVWLVSPVIMTRSGGSMYSIWLFISVMRIRIDCMQIRIHKICEILIRIQVNKITKLIF